MKKTVIIVVIAVLSVVAICLGILIALMPDQVDPIPVDPHTPNSLIASLGIERPNTIQERLIAIKTYEGEISVDDLIELGKVGGLEYYELDPEAKDYLLITPFEINGTMNIYSVGFDGESEKYVANNLVHECNGGEPLPDNYALLLKYSRPSTPQYQIDLVQEDNVAAYQFLNVELVDKMGKYAPVKTLQFVKEYIEGDFNPETESFGKEIKIIKEE